MGSPKAAHRFLLCQPHLNQSSLVNHLMVTLDHRATDYQLYSNTVIRTLAVDGWAVTFRIARTSLGGLRPRPVPFSLCQV